MFRALASLTLLLALACLPDSACLAQAARTTPLLTQALPNIENKEVVMLTVEYAPGQSSPAHRHNANTFVYVIEGTLLMGVKGKEPVRVDAGQTFYESPTDVHTVSRNASDTAPARFLVFFIREKGAPTMAPPG
jgi:quercetin dioxygenase-like cupin family protein